jgi:hypothetical protein
MLDKDVGDALLKLNLSPQTDPPIVQVERIIEADQRRVTRWTRISISLWVVAALGSFLIFVMGGFTFPLIAKLVAEQGQGSLENPNTPLTVLAKLVAMCMVFGTASFMMLVLAGLATVLLLLRSRTATLRQINANLLQISELLKSKPAGGTQSAP